MKQKLLEYLIRTCIKEVLSQKKKIVTEGDPDIKGAAAPPADGQGTGDAPAIPNDKPNPEQPSNPETPEMPDNPQSSQLKGIILINPKDKSSLRKLPLQLTTDSSLERKLYNIAASVAGPKVKTAISTIRLVKDAIKNPNTTTYLYLGKYDPNSDEVFLMADKSLQVAKNSTVPPEEIGAPSSTVATTTQTGFEPTVAEPGEYAAQLDARGKSLPGVEPDPRDDNLNEQFKKVIKKMVNDVLDNNRGK